jgi:diguanylate cyclase (GGDEF)-like protein
VNDTQGHDFGDKLLREVAIRLADVMRESDTLARLGGDEFVMVLNSLNGKESAATAAQRVLSIFSEPFVVDGIKISSSASVGIALYPDDGPDAETLFLCADTAMYHSKTETRSHYCFFSAEMNEQTMRRVALENALRQGGEKNEFALHYQPQWDLKTGKMVGVEALLRWESADFGILQPSEFIPMAEKSGLILGLGEWVLRTACTQARNWSMAGHRDLKVAINISGKQFNQFDFLQMVERIIEETGVSSEIIELEFTESIFMGDTDRTIDIFKSLKKMGLQLSIDDFGTGYSSLGYLKHFPIDRIKIDRSFISDVNQIADDAAIAEAIISLGHGLNLKVMAEGVETAAQMNFLTARNCDEIQGFYLAKPMTAMDLVEKMRVWNQHKRAGDYSDPQLIEATLSLGRPEVRFAECHTSETQGDK